MRKPWNHRVVLAAVSLRAKPMTYREFWSTVWVGCAWVSSGKFVDPGVAAVPVFCQVPLKPPKRVGPNVLSSHFQASASA